MDIIKPSGGKDKALHRSGKRTIMEQTTGNRGGKGAPAGERGEDDMRIADGTDDGAVWTVSGTERTALTFGRINVVREQSLADTGWTTLLFDMCLVFVTEIMQSGKYRVWSGLSQSTQGILFNVVAKLL